MISVRVELEGVREKLTSMFAERDNKLGKIVSTELEKQLTEQAVKDRISIVVAQCLDKAIENIANVSVVQHAVSQYLGEQVAKALKDDTPTT